jgi:hypothetical protein
MKFSKLLVILFVITITGFVPGCGSDDEASGSGTGTLSLNLTDAPGDYAAVYITIDEVRIHKGDEDGEQDGDGEWITVGNPEQTYDLIELTNGVMENIGIANLETGVYTQLRLLLGETQSFPDEYTPVGPETDEANYIVIETADAYETHALKIPSGFESGIKLVHEVDIVEGLTVELVLDFDAKASVVKAGSSGQYILKPTIKVIDTEDNFTLTGTVTDIDDSTTTIADADVTAQEYDDTSLTLYGATRTDDTGNYMMYLEPGTYAIAASAIPGYYPECVAGIEAISDGAETQSFELIPTTESTRGTVTVTVTIDDFDEENDTATLSFRQDGLCDVNGDDAVDEDDQIEVHSIPVVSDGIYEIELPTGSYTMVATSSDGRTATAAVEVPADGENIDETLDLPN